MFDFDITPKTTKKTVTRKKKITKKVSEKDEGLINELIAQYEDQIAKRQEDIEDLKKHITALQTKKDIPTLLSIRRSLAKKTILKKPDEDKQEKAVARLVEFDSILNLDRSNLDPLDLYYFKGN